MFHYLELICLSPDTRFLLYLYYKSLLFVFELFKISKKVQKKKFKKPKSQTGKDVIFGSSRVVSPSNRAPYITFVGWVSSLNFGTVLIFSEFISTEWLSFQSLWSLCRCLLCRRDVPVCISILCYLYSVTIHRYALVRRKLKPKSAIPGIVTSSCTL